MHMTVGVPTYQERKNNVFTYFSKLCSEAENINNKKNRHPEKGEKEKRQKHSICSIGMRQHPWLKCSGKKHSYVFLLAPKISGFYTRAHSRLKLIHATGITIFDYVAPCREDREKKMN